MDNKISISPFYVGQEIVSTQNYEGLKKGADYIVIALNTCLCGDHLVDVGFRHGFGVPQVCGLCSRGVPNSTVTQWFRAARFAPKMEITAFKTMSEVANVEIFSAN